MAIAAMLRRPRTVTDGVTMCTGDAAPSRIGPTATPPEVTFSRLKAMFAASRPGAMRRLAAPFSREFGKISSQGLRESHVHDVIITKEAPNYRVE